MRLLFLFAAFAAMVGLKPPEPPSPPSLENQGENFRYGYHGDGKLAKPHFHPLEAKVGESWIRLTRSFPMERDVAGESKDHPHHRGLWFCHGDVIAEGGRPPALIPGVQGTDFWSEGIGRGRIACTRIGASYAPAQPPNDAFTLAWNDTDNDWRSADGSILLKEKRNIGRRVLAGDASPRLLIIDSTLTAADRAITFGDTKEGSFAVRVNDQFSEKRGGQIRNSAGKKTEKECWGQLADWCDYSGKVDGQPCGLAIFDHPDNAPRACWHVRAYGLMAANPFGRAKSGFPAMRGRTDLVKLQPGESLRLRYGVLLYAGEKAADEIQKEYEAFVKLAK